jgi:hypothetical protein
VWREDGPPPTFKHLGPGDAEREAMRLADLNPGQSFVVLCPIARVVCPPKVRIERFDLTDDGIPF